MRNSESESGNNLNLLLPIALLAVLLIVPFSINALMHMLAAKRVSSPLIMKIPFDSQTISIPEKIKQYQDFEVTLNLDTNQLAKFLNEIVSTAAEGTSIQGIIGTVSPSMKAEVVSEVFKIDKLGPQDPFSAYNNNAKWRWLVTPEASGTHSLKIQLHLSTQHNGKQTTKVLDFAEANFAVEANMAEWLNRNAVWIMLFLTIPAILIWKLRQHYAKQP